MQQVLGRRKSATGRKLRLIPDWGGVPDHSGVFSDRTFPAVVDAFDFFQITRRVFHLAGALDTL